MKKPFILHIAPTPFFADRGCHMRIAGIVGGLNKLGLKNLVCTYHHGRDVEGISTARTLSIPGYTKTTAGYSSFKFLANIFLVIMVVWKVIFTKPDVIHGHLHEGALIGYFARLFVFWRKTPLVFDVQGSLSGELVAYGKLNEKSGLFKLVYMVESFICKLPNLFMCSSMNSLNILNKQFGVPESKLVLTKDGTDVSSFQCEADSKLRSMLGIKEEIPILVFSGSLLPAKGLEELKELITDVCSQELDLHFLVIGYPVEEFDAWVNDRGYSEKVTTTGQLAYEKLPQYLAIADFALEPKAASAGEASGKLINYMAASLPVVCFDTPLNRNLLHDGGFYADENSRSLIDAVKVALACPAARLHDIGHENHSRIAQIYSWDNTAKVIVENYDKLLP